MGGDLFDIALSASSGGNGLAVLPSESGDGRALKAADFDSYPRPVLTAGLAGVRRAGGTVAWTAVVRNRGRVAAQGVRLRLAICCGTRLVAARPGGTRSGLQVTWTVPRLAVGRSPSGSRSGLRRDPRAPQRLVLGRRPPPGLPLGAAPPLTGTTTGAGRYRCGGGRAADRRPVLPPSPAAAGSGASLRPAARRRPDPTAEGPTGAWR